MTDRKDERIVALATADDKRRIKRYCETKGLVPSDFIRDTLLTKVRAWEKKQGLHDAEPVRV